jgi:hypothetical protein
LRFSAFGTDEFHGTEECHGHIGWHGVLARSSAGSGCISTGSAANASRLLAGSTAHAGAVSNAVWGPVLR